MRAKHAAQIRRGVHRAKAILATLNSPAHLGTFYVPVSGTELEWKAVSRVLHKRLRFNFRGYWASQLGPSEPITIRHAPTIFDNYAARRRKPRNTAPDRPLHLGLTKVTKP